METFKWLVEFISIDFYHFFGAFVFTSMVMHCISNAIANFTLVKYTVIKKGDVDDEQPK